MRRLLTNGIKAILAIAVLSVAGHWALRVQRTPGNGPVGMAAIPDPVQTGSIAPQKVERRAAEVTPTSSYDQDQLTKLFSGAETAPAASAGPPKAKPQKAAIKPPAAKPVVKQAVTTQPAAKPVAAKLVAAKPVTAKPVTAKEIVAKLSPATQPVAKMPAPKLSVEKAPIPRALIPNQPAVKQVVATR